MSRGLKYIAVLTALMLSFSLSVTADDCVKKGIVRTVDPISDSLALAKLRYRLDSIHMHRPSVALVLSGGGAKGAAHVGVIRYLESIGIPIDAVFGTSMGGLVGGIYSLGYDSGELYSIMKSIDWNKALSDRVPRKYISYAQMKYKERYVLSFPFYYSKKYFLSNEEKADRYSGQAERYDPLKLGAGSENATDLVKRNILGSLPSGYIYGQNVNNIISSLTAGYQDDMDFINLPIPFMCIAADMVSGKAYLWHEGKMATALRSTMSVPGLFAPVRTKGMVLVDGGIRDNYPNDIAKAAGADIIIGVDLSDGYRGYKDIRNLGDIISQGVDMLGRTSYEKNVSIPRVTIKPKLSDFNMMSFDDKSIDTIIARGYQAALEQAENLAIVKSIVGKEIQAFSNVKAVDLNKYPIVLSKITIKGVKENEQQLIMRKIPFKPGQLVKKEDIEGAVAAVYGTGAFDFVTYEILGHSNPFELVLQCKRGPINQIGLGARFDTEEVVSLLVNLGINVHRLRGSAYNIEAKIGTNPYGSFHYSYDGPSMPTINASMSFRWTDRNNFSVGKSNLTVAYSNLRQEIYLSNMKWSMFDLKCGLRNDHFKVESVMADAVIGNYDFDNLRNNYMSAFLFSNAENFDNTYFPTRGHSYGVKYMWTFAGFPHHFENFHSVHAHAKWVINGGKLVTIIPSADMRFLLGNDAPISYINMMGGSIAGRYLEQQMPFIGINNVTPMRSNLIILRTDLRFRLAKNNYLTAIFNFADDFDEFDTVVDENYGTFGAGLEYAYNSILGPVRANIHWSSLTHHLGAYMSIGFNF